MCVQSAERITHLERELDQARRQISTLEAERAQSAERITHLETELGQIFFSVPHPTAANRPEGNNDATVHIKVMDEDGTLTSFNLKKNIGLEVLMKAYSEHQLFRKSGLSIQSYRQMQMERIRRRIEGLPDANEGLRFLLGGPHHVSRRLLWLSF